MASEDSATDTVKPRASIQSATDSSSSQHGQEDALIKPRQRRYSRRAHLEALRNSEKEGNPDDPDDVNNEGDAPAKIEPRKQTPNRRHSRKEFDPDDPDPPSSPPQDQQEDAPQEDTPSSMPQIVPKKRQQKRHSRRARLVALQSGIEWNPCDLDDDDDDITPFDVEMHDDTLRGFQTDQDQESAPSNTPSSNNNSPRNHTDSTASTNVSSIRKVSPMVESIRAAGNQVPKNWRKWPRCHACCFGVLIPLNVIIVLSLVGGLFLGFLEMKEELHLNDLAIRQQMAGSDIQQSLETVFVDQLPQLCLGLFQENVTSPDFNSVFEEMVRNETMVETYIGAARNSTNATDATTQQHTIPHGKTLQEMSYFFSECAQAAASFREEFLSLFQGTEDAGALTFNFIRCVNRSSPLAYNIKMWPSEEDVEDALYDNQAQLYADSWRISQQKLQEKYLEESEDGTTITELQALTQSYEDATGEQYCGVNVPSSAWFWFTVMSTSGYGNQPPKTTMGRFFTCVLGFVTIIMFGGMLGTAGGIISHIMTDCLKRCKRNISSIRMIALWGALWLLWMLVISYQTMAYKEVRLQWDNFPLGDAYWFSFISTTTVGLGDVYFEPEGLFVSDLLGLWANFLVGFCALSAFLNELSGLVFSVAPDIVGDLQRNLKYADDCYDGDPGAEQEPSMHGIQRTTSREYKRRNPAISSITPVMRRTTTNDSFGLLRMDTNSSIRSTVTRPTILSNESRTSSAPASFTVDPNESGEKQPLQRTLSSAKEDSENRQSKTLLSGLQRKQQPAPPQASGLQQKAEPAKPSQPQQNTNPPGLQRKQQPAPESQALQRQGQPAKPSQQQQSTQPPGLQTKTEPAKPPQQQNSTWPPGLQRQQQPTQPPVPQRKVEPTKPPQQQQLSAWIKMQQPPPQQVQQQQQETNPPQAIPAPPPPQQPQKSKPQWPPPKKQKKKITQWPPPKKQQPASNQQKQQPAKPSQQSAASTKQHPAKAPQQQQQQQAKPPQKPSTQQRLATFINTGLDPAMAKAELYFQTTRWGPLGHEDAPISVTTNTGDQWYIVANGVYAKLFKISEGSQQQQFTI